MKINTQVLNNLIVIALLTIRYCSYPLWSSKLTTCGAKQDWLKTMVRLQVSSTQNGVALLSPEFQNESTGHKNACIGELWMTYTLAKISDQFYVLRSLFIFLLKSFQAVK